MALGSGSNPNVMHRRIDQYLDTDGDGTGTTNAIGDYSGGEEIFYIQPPAGTVYSLNRMMVFVQDAGTFDSAKYGNGVGLTTGIVVRVQDDEGTLDTMTGVLPVKTNTHWKRLCYDAVVSKDGTGDETLGARWTFTKDSGEPIILNGNANERLEVVLNDAFDDLVAQTFMVKGKIL